MRKAVRKTKEDDVLNHKHVKKTIKSNRSLDQSSRVSKAIYSKTEHRGFVPGHDMDDWI